MKTKTKMTIKQIQAKLLEWAEEVKQKKQQDPAYEQAKSIFLEPQNRPM